MRSGASEQAALRAGIGVGRLTRKLYLLSALCAGIGGVLYTARFTAGAAQAGEPLLLDSIAAVVIGGASLFGGSGTILGTVAGSLVIAVIQYGLVFIDVEPFWQFVAVGVVIIISVLVDQTAAPARRRTLMSAVPSSSSEPDPRRPRASRSASAASRRSRASRSRSIRARSWHSRATTAPASRRSPR